MVTTKKDGSKTKEYLSPEDPRIAKIGVTKRLKVPASDADSAVDSLREEMSVERRLLRVNNTYSGNNFCRSLYIFSIKNVGLRTIYYLADLDYFIFSTLQPRLKHLLAFQDLG